MSTRKGAKNAAQNSPKKEIIKKAATNIDRKNWVTKTM